MSAGEPRWLDATQQGHWRAYLRASALLTEALNRDIEAQAALSLNEYEVLVRLSEAPGRAMRMSALAGMIVHSRSRLTHTIHRMERRGLVERRACAADGRGVDCVLLPLGWRTLVDAAPGHVDSVREHLIDVLTPEELDVLGRAMARVADRLSPEVAGGCDEDGTPRAD